MQYIAKHTTIPVPKVYCAFQRKNRAYIVMESLKGKSICNGWKVRSAESQLRILQQLRNMVDSLRSLVPPSHMVANVHGGPLLDGRLPESPFGPFDSIEAFHRYLRGGLDNKSDRLPAIVNELIELHQVGHWSSPVLTHSDLSSLNIIADGDTVTGIIDWETSGWYPEYWEYTTASYVNPYNEFWKQEVDKFLTPFPEALHMEELPRVYFGDI
ncbi:hypothetical protein AMS68_007905 [Peltaster fructicola]|uniref:Aminoglycoside phosphotransferase domain-containing protein n=1 Tax=Peltaster fructicola TaxID=286661 RepID=A0A6H0Y6A5_9PEZI|nr:hypothetical protein AMS68_007905 [Peltaster fructicola]